VQEQEQEDYHSPRDKVPRELENNRRVKSIHKKKIQKPRKLHLLNFHKKENNIKAQFAEATVKRT